MRASAVGGGAFVPRDAATGRIQLKPAQQRVLAGLKASPETDLTRGQYEELTGVSRSQAAYDLAELVEAGLLHRVGAGRATRYRLPREGGGGQRQWTSDRIRAELAAFCDGRETWPSAAAFKAAGRGDLYVAASRYGGIAHWTEALGYPRERPPAPADREHATPAEPREHATPAEPREHATPATPKPTSVWGKISWAVAGGLAAVGLVVAGVVVVGLPNVSKPNATPSPGNSRAAPSSHATTPPARHTAPQRKKHTTTTRQVRRANPRTAKRKPTTRRHTATPTGTSPVKYSSNERSTYSPPATYSAPQHSTTPPPSSSGSSGPAPLAAPPSGGAPQPIPPPHR
jgi:hypothetical protein